MAHFGIISPPVSGHLNPFGALGRELQARGHRVTLIHMEDLQNKARSEELEFYAIGGSSHPLGSLPKSLETLGRLKGFAALRYTIASIAKTTRMFFEDGPQAIAQLKPDALLVDQTEPVGASLAERAGIPHITICNALIMNRDPNVPPPFTPWSYSKNSLAHWRNRMGYITGDMVMHPIFKIVRAYRAAWGLPAYHTLEDSFSSRAIISQQPAAFEYPRTHLPPYFSYVGPLRRPLKIAVPFPWEKLTGAPVIYGSLGSLQGSKANLFQVMAEACRSLPVQLIVSHNHSLTDEAIARLARTCLVVPYAPQLELMARAQLVITHGGLNTVLDAMSQGVPMVVLPITYEQPAIAGRVRWAGVGEVIAPSRLTVRHLQNTIQNVLSVKTYLERAKSLARSIHDAGGVRKAADIVTGVIASQR